MSLQKCILTMSLLLCVGVTNAQRRPNDASDSVMPDVIANDASVVEVMMKYINLKECFPDQTAKVRFENNRVKLEDLKLYENIQADFSEGVTAFELNGNWGACDREGKIVIQPKLTSHFVFHEGLAAVELGNKLGFINKKGEWVINPQFDIDYHWFFIGNVCAVKLNGEWIIINRKGETIINSGLVLAENRMDGIYIETQGGLKRYLDDSGRMLPENSRNERYYRMYLKLDKRAS